MCACTHAIHVCVWVTVRLRVFFFHLPVKCFTLATAWKGSLIEKLSGRGICHPPCCSVTTLIHAQPDHNREASHSTSQREGGPLHSGGIGKGGVRQAEEKRERKRWGRPTLINNPLDFKPPSHICGSTKASYSLTCLPVLFFISMWELATHVCQGLSVIKLFLAQGWWILLLLLLLFLSIPKPIQASLYGSFLWNGAAAHTA